MLPRCHPDSETIVDTMMGWRKTLGFLEKGATQHRISIGRMINLTLWMMYRSFLAIDNDVERANSLILWRIATGRKPIC
jgi:hypothetical protein